MSRASSFTEARFPARQWRDVLNGANVFAIEAGGEWEIFQAQHCVLVAPDEYEMSGLLRGRLGSAHAIEAPHPVGARMVLLDQKLRSSRASTLARTNGARRWKSLRHPQAPPRRTIARRALR
jgi:hypothetical protein